MNPLTLKGAQAMPEQTTLQRYRSRRGGYAILVGLAVVGLLLAACSLGLLAVQQRVLTPPPLVLRLGHTEFAAPCPPRVFVCDASTPWYAIWRGEDQPDGSITYRQLFFMYLRSNSPAGPRGR
jgi:hypothetical protein